MTANDITTLHEKDEPRLHGLMSMMDLLGGEIVCDNCGRWQRLGTLADSDSRKVAAASGWIEKDGLEPLPHLCNQISRNAVMPVAGCFDRSATLKLRHNQLVAIECSWSDGGFIMRPIILQGGEYAEHNRLAMIENMERIYGDKWDVRIVYHWRSWQHLRRWLNRGEKWKGREVKWWAYG